MHAMLDNILLKPPGTAQNGIWTKKNLLLKKFIKPSSDANWSIFIIFVLKNHFFEQFSISKAHSSDTQVYEIFRKKKEEKRPHN